MPSARNFEHLLDKPGVVAVSYDESEDTVRTWVAKKKPRSALSPNDLVSEGVPDDQQTDVVDAGLDDGDEGFTPELLDPDNPPIEAFSDRHTRHRPIREGVSEINANSTAATSGHYPVRVTDTSKGNWSGVVSEGDLVRVSNNHVYARSDQADFGEETWQPSPADGGNEDDTSGSLVGYLPLEDGVQADIAARSTTRETDGDTPHEMADSCPTAIRREMPSVGETLTKTGRTTGVTQGDVIGVGASVRVSYPVGTVTLRDQILTEDMSTGGDSGSSVFDADDALLGLLFAGSSRVTVHSLVANAERDFGIEYLTAEPAEDDGESDTGTGTGDGSGDDSDSGSGSGSDSDGDSGGETGSGTGDGDQTDDGTGGSGGTDGGDNDGDSDMPTEKNFEDYLAELLADEYGPDNVLRQQHLSTGDIPDFVVFDHDTKEVLCYELENDEGSLSSPQAIYYTKNAAIDLRTEGTVIHETLVEMGEDPQLWTTSAVTCVPAGVITSNTIRQIYDDMESDLREEDVPEGVSIKGV